MLSKKVKYALKAVLYMARNYDEGLIIVSDISKAEYIPYKFLEKILAQLKQRGVLSSKIGRQGGYSLSRPPEEITMGEIIRIVEGKIAPIACVSKAAYVKCYDCENEKTCEIRRTMQLVRDAMVKILDNTSLKDALTMGSGSIRHMGYSLAL